MSGNPGTSWIAQARQVADARARGAKLIVVDPRRVGAASKADLWLRVRPGTDGALALGIARVVLEEGWYDRDFVRDLTNAPFLVHGAQSRLLRESDLAGGGAPDRFVVWNAVEERAEAVPRAPTHGARWALEGEVTVPTLDGPVRCRTVLDAWRAQCAPFTGDALEAMTGVPAEDVRAAAEMLTHSGPVAYYAWSGVGQHTNATQTDRAISCLYALTGSLGRRGGNVELAPDVVAAQHGWWQACRELDLPGFPVHGEATANLNATIGTEHADPVSGSIPLRSYLCEVRRSG